MIGGRLSRCGGALAAGLPRAIAYQLLLAATIMLAGSPVAWAQTGRPTIIVAATLSLQPKSQAPLAIRIAPGNAVAPGCFVRVHGLPATAALSGGHSIAPGAWAIPVSALPTLKILVPAETSGRSEITITLVSPEGMVITDAKATLVIAAPAAADSRASLATPEVASRRPALTEQVNERAMRLLKRGDEQLAEGGIAQARLLYERAADTGLALGAMAMAATYDAIELQRLGVRGLKPDPEAARRWYERAAQLGAPEARLRLRRLRRK